MALPDFTEIETIDVVVPMPIEEVRQRLRAETNLTWMGTGTFQGTVGDDSFRLRLRKVQRRNLRPTLVGTLESVPGGTRIRGECALPWWAKGLGRAAFFGAVVGGIGTLGTALSVGPAELGAYFYLLLGATAAMPFAAVLVPGLLVSQAVDERKAVPDAVAAMLAPARLPKEPLPTGTAAKGQADRLTE